MFANIVYKSAVLRFYAHTASDLNDGSFRQPGVEYFDLIVRSNTSYESWFYFIHE